MNLKAFSVYDIKAEAYLPPFFVPTLGMALRAFKDCAVSDSHQFGKNPEDYVLYEIGHFDDHTGELVHTRPKGHGTALAARGELPRLVAKEA